MALGKIAADEVGMSQVSGGVEVSLGMVDLASYEEVTWQVKSERERDIRW